MSLKKLFGQGVKNYESASVNVESSTFVDKKVKEQETYLPPIDFATASNFVKYGLAELYYDSSISRIYDNYPYDGSKAEIVDFHQSSSYLDRWMYDQKYPKSTGYVNLGTTGYQGGMTNGYGNTTTNEFIRVWGGIHTASTGMSTKPLRETFDKSGKYELSLNRTQNWRCDPVSGSTIEFWLRVPSFNSTLTERQVILHLDNGVTPGAALGGSLVLQIYRTCADNGIFQLSMKDGTSTPSGPLLQDISDAITDASFSAWHHYAITIANGSTGLDTTLYVDGAETKKVLNIGSAGLLAELPGLINGYVGALQTTTPSSQGGLGKGKLSGSLDEFRFWKKARTGQQIGLNWFRQVGGGANSDDSTANKDLGVYLRFNEGITGIVATDQIALDYSGRLANGHWQGYTTSTQRNTGSAMASSSYAYVEDENPIIYSTNSRVISLKTEMQTSGSIHDNEIGGSIFHSLPSWMADQDLEEGAGNLRSLTQIIASYFDTLHAQITALPNLKDKGYVQKDNKPLPFASKLLTDKGFIIRDIFVDAEIVNMFSGVDFDSIKFEEQLDRTKNLIYTNIYNNLEAIYKSKGTEKSIRNFIRCFGIDDEIIKLNVYTDGGTHYFTDKAKGSSVKKKYMNFDDPSYFSSTLFQTSSATNALTFITGSIGSISASNNAFTLEADIVVPYKRETNETGYFETPFLSSSIFGFHEAIESDPTDYTWSTSVTASLGVYLVRDTLNSKNAKFVVKSQDETIYLTSDYVENIYDNNHWNMALRIKPDTYPYAGNVTNTAPAFNVEFYAANYNFDTLENEISLTKSVSYASGSAFLSNPKRVYAGANLTNFTGSTVEQSDMQVGGVRAWLDYIENSAIQQHNKDPLNFGNTEAYRGSNIFTLANKNIPAQDLIIFNWEFDVVTGSSAAGDFIVNDLTSGSTDVIYDSWLDEIIRREYRGKGYGFGTTQTSFVENEYLYAQRKELPEISYTNDNVFIKTEKDINFIVDDDVSDNFYALEKSLNQIVSEEMLKAFASIQEFANLMGRPVDRYRMNYKSLEKVRQDFFNRVEGDPDQERFMNFYKWIDGSISQMVNQLIPAGVNFGSGVTDVVESHILERNKYQRRIGLLDQLESTEGSMKGVQELTYNWKFGHSPVPVPAVASAGSISSTSAVPADYDLGTVSIIDTAGTVKVFVFDDSGTPATGTVVTGQVVVQINGLGESFHMIEQLQIAILGSTGFNGTILAVRNSSTLNLTQSVAGTAGDRTITVTALAPAGVSKVDFTGGTEIDYRSYDNCLWHHLRADRTKLVNGIADAETIRKAIINQTNATSSALSTVDKTIYQGSTFIARRLSRPYKIGIEFGNNIHAGINYNLQKDREFYKRATQWFSAKDSVGVMENIYTVGITTGSAIIETQRCDDVYNPNAKTYQHFECVVGRNSQGIFGDEPTSPSLEYIYRMNSSMYWPFNVVSGSVNSGYNSMVVESYNSSSIVTNLHSDTIDLTNEISIQGPFTRAHVGGNQFRHQPLNKYDATLTNPGGGATLNNLRNVYTRAEGYRYLFGENPLSDPTLPSDGAMGLTGPDYGVIPGGKAGDVTKKFAVWFREERAKRPVNIKNIQSTTGSSVLGNYEHKYEVVSTFGMTDQKFLLRRMSNDLGMMGKSYLTLPQTTQIFSYLVGPLLPQPTTLRNPVYETARAIPTPRTDLTGSKSIIVTKFSAPGSLEVSGRAFKNITSDEFSVYNSINYRNLSVQGSGSGEIGTIRVNSNLNKREGNRTLLARHLGKGGTDSQWGSISWEDSGSLTPMAAFYKQNQNTLVTPRINGTSLRKAINSPTTAGVNKCYLSNQSVAYPWSQTGAISYSFWINVTTTSNDQRILEGFAAQYIKIDTDKIEVSFEDINTNANTWTFPYTNTDTWSFIVISWSGNPASDITVFINNIEQTVTRTVTASPANPTRALNPEIYLMDGPGTVALYELQGSLTDFAVWTTGITAEQVSELYNIDGKALGVSFYSSLIDYWRLGTEKVLSSIPVGTGIPFGTIIPSDIGKNILTAADNLSSSAGPYTTNTSEDTNVYDNMNYNSLLPRSDFQYSWIRQTLSGSNWMDKQKVRGYAPKSGEMIFVGNGALTKLETAINWPLISTITCEETCDTAENTPVKMRFSYTANSPQTKDATSPTVTSLNLEVEATPSTSTEITVANFYAATFSALSECCEGTLEYASVCYGVLLNGSTKAATPPVSWYTTPPDFPSHNGVVKEVITDAGEITNYVAVDLYVRCGTLDNQFVKMQIKLLDNGNGVQWTTNF